MRPSNERASEGQSMILRDEVYRVSQNPTSTRVCLIRH